MRYVVGVITATYGLLLAVEVVDVPEPRTVAVFAFIGCGLATMAASQR